MTEGKHFKEDSVLSGSKSADLGGLEDAEPQHTQQTQQTQHIAYAKQDASDTQNTSDTQHSADAQDTSDAQHASSTHHMSAGELQPAEGFVSASAHARRGDRGRRRSNYRESDPYNVKGNNTSNNTTTTKQRRFKIISRVLFAIGIILIVVAATMFISSQLQYQRQDELNSKLASYATVQEDGNTSPQVDWASLKSLNSEVVGWVQVPGTLMNFPVYQAEDNDKYLHLGADGQYAVGGQVFLDALNTSPGMVDQQSIIYGHNMYNGTMFKPVHDMLNQELFDSIQTVWYVTEQKTYELEPLMVYETVDTDDNVRMFNFENEDAYKNYLTDLLNKAAVKRSDAADLIASGGHVLSLITCNYYDPIEVTGRTILVAIEKPAS